MGGDWPLPAGISYGLKTCQKCRVVPENDEHIGIGNAGSHDAVRFVFYTKMIDMFPSTSVSAWPAIGGYPHPPDHKTKLDRIPDAGCMSIWILSIFAYKKFDSIQSIECHKIDSVC